MTKRSRSPQIADSASGTESTRTAKEIRKELPNIPVTCADCERWKTVYIASQEMLRDLMADRIDNALEQSDDYEKLPDGRWKRRQA